jgi:hypothetical protein
MIKFNLSAALTGVSCNVLFKTHYVFRNRRLLDPLSDMVITRHSDGIHVEKIKDNSTIVEEQSSDLTKSTLIKMITGLTP